MALIVEDGTGVAGAESYISVSNADTYFANRGNAAWAALNATVKEQALRKATDYMTQMYRTRWKGFRTYYTQSLDWPRAWVERIDAMGGYRNFPSYYVQNVVPAEIANACAELANRAAVADLLADQERGVLSEKVGPIETTYDKNTPQRVRFPAVDSLLAPFLAGGGASMRLVRS